MSEETTEYGAWKKLQGIKFVVFDLAGTVIEDSGAEEGNVG
jgi:hypothetical protein